jgi:8-oxo-dGTP pyrophosphatase MutT (NUDIX family)
MVAGSLLPITIHKNKLYFLFGKENSLETSAPGYSDFGGGCEGRETPYETALREGGEELTGFLGDSAQLRKHIDANGGVYKVLHNHYHAHLFYLEYDARLPVYYNQNHRFLWDRMNRKMLKRTKLFEKIEIGWFSLEDLAVRRNEFRGFYREIVDLLLAQAGEIFAFAKRGFREVRSSSRARRHTRKSLGLGVGVGVGVGVGTGGSDGGSGVMILGG